MTDAGRGCDGLGFDRETRGQHSDGPCEPLPQVTSIRNGGGSKPGRGAPVDLPGLAARSLQQVRRNGTGA